MEKPNVNIEFVLGQYLSRLRRQERNKSDGKRVPTQKEIAEFIGMTPTAFSRIVQNRVDSIDRKNVALVLWYLRECGFDTGIEQLFTVTQEPQP